MIRKNKVKDSVGVEFVFFALKAFFVEGEEDALAFIELMDIFIL